MKLFQWIFQQKTGKKTTMDSVCTWMARFLGQTGIKLKFLQERMIQLM